MARVHSNTPEALTRVLPRCYATDGNSFVGSATGTKAIGLVAPTQQQHSMGVAGHNGVVSFVCVNGGNQAYTVYCWSSKVAQINSGNGWFKNGGNSTQYTQADDQLAKISFTITEGESFCIVAGTTPVTDVALSGAADPCAAGV